MEPEGSVPRYSREGLFFYAHFTEVTDIRKLKKYTPTPFMAKRSHYDKALADYAVSFIQCLCHTKGTWAGKPFELIDGRSGIILRPVRRGQRERLPAVQHRLHRDPKENG